MGGGVLWNEVAKNDEDLAGFSLYRMFDVVTELTKNNRLDHIDPDAVIFNSFLQRLRNGENTREDWKEVVTRLQSILLCQLFLASFVFLFLLGVWACGVSKRTF